MRAEVWCKRDLGRGVEAVLAWTGEIAAIPAVDSYVVVHDGWASERVLSTHYSLYDASVCIEIAPDYMGEYANRAKESPTPGSGARGE